MPITGDCSFKKEVQGMMHVWHYSIYKNTKIDIHRPIFMSMKRTALVRWVPMVEGSAITGV